jgi:hypothetical protein
MRIFPKYEKKEWSTMDEVFERLRYRSWWHKNSVGGRIAFFFLRFKYIGKRFEDFLYGIKTLWEIIVRGYSDEEVWEFSNRTTRYIYPRLVMLKNRYHGIGPGKLLAEMFPDEIELSSEQENAMRECWMEIMDKMIYAFGLLLDDDTTRRTETQVARIDEGLSLFAKYYECLWD